MFEQSFLPRPARTRRAFTVLVSFACQMLGIGIAVLIPFVLTERMPAVRMQIAPPTAPRGKPPAPKTPEHVKVVDVGRQSVGRTVLAYRYIPPTAARIEDRQPFDDAPPDIGGGVTGGVGDPRGMPEGVIGGIVRMAAQGPAPPQQPVVHKQEPPPEPRQIQRIKQGGDVQEARLIQRVIPVFPPLARAARLSGTVRLQATIGVDGRVRDLMVIGGHHLFIEAALAAVRQWAYRPTHLNGEPVEVLTQIDVHFIFGR